MPPFREKELFLQALDIDDPAGREAFLAESCEDDPQLRESVGKLLAALEESPDRFEPENYPTLGSERSSVRTLVSGDARFLDQLADAGGSLGNYELLEELGRGAMGIVFRARQAGLDREVALKIILNAGLASPDERQRFRHEAAAAARLHHPNIVPIHEIGTADEHDYYSMALVTGGTLGSLLKDGGRITPRDAVGLILPVVDAVESAHEHGIIHRDLKPDNILLTPEREPMVADFGLARLVEAEDGLTLSGQILGTPRYMAPEVAVSAAAASTRSDIYALGAILYEMLVGDPLFEGGSVLTTLRMVHEQAPVRPRVKVPEVELDLETIVLKCLEKSPADRYATARALAEDLEAFLDHRPIAARPPGPVERIAKWTRRRPVHATLAGLATIVVLSLGIGGPMVAVRQGKLRGAAESASREAESARQSAELAAAEARHQAETNRRLAYSANQRYIQLSHELQGDSSLASETMIGNWIPEAGARDFRGWEWYYNYSRIHSDEKTFHIEGAVAHIDFDFSGEWVAVSGTRGTEIRNTLSGALVRHLPTPGGHRKCFWSTDGQKLLTLSTGGDLELWDPRNGDRHSAPGLPGGIVDADWKHDTLVTLDTNGIRIWRFDLRGSAEAIGVVATGEASWRRIALNPGGTFVATTDATATLRLWNLSALDQPPLKFDGAASPLAAIDWKPDGHWIAASTEQGAIRIWEVPGGQRVAKIQFKGGAPVRDLAWNPAGDQIALLQPLGDQVDVFDLVASKGKALRGFGSGQRPLTLAWSPDAHTIAIGADSGLVALVRHGLPAATVELFHHSEPIVSLRWSEDGESISCLAGDHRSFRIDTTTRKVSEPPGADRSDSPAPPAVKPDSEIRVDSPDGQHFATGDGDGSITLWKAGEKLPIRRIKAHRDPVLALTWHPRGDRFASAGTDGSVRIWDPETGEPLLTLSGHKGPVHDIAWDADGRRLASCGEDGTVWIWDARAGYLLATE
ncbi:WD40 repeat domain-containing serine/threonine protein kinase [Luteolibacter marinus]|uniref:WD40 repeat domain-containing serine/threonine protein kinase n=1 Tax=Luteolibacter marinus TaxID=2776705 RepID=UPI0018669AC4|nr:protein kinase [Luteolibacter marinus]